MAKATRLKRVAPPPAPSVSPVWTHHGPLTISQARQFKEQLVKRLAATASLTLDLSDTEPLDSAGLQIIASALRAGTMRLIGVSDAVRKKLADAGCLALVGL